MYENLHCHTKTSDGELSYKKALDVCAENKISIVAFTDHDSVPNEKALKILEKNRGHFTKWVIGIEISSGWPKEIKGAASNFHIVGLFVDPNNKELKKHCQKAKDAREQRMRSIVNNLQKLGFKITAKDCLKESKGESTGRPHIVSALEKNKKNLKIIENLRIKMEKATKNNPKILEKYETMMERGPSQYPYALFLGSQAFIKNVFVSYIYRTDMDKSVSLIRNAGGVAILAHWTFSKDKVNKEVIGKLFQEKRLDGGEIVFGVNAEENLKNAEIIKDMKTMEALTEKYKMIQSGGGDSHRKKDFVRFAQAKQLAEKTIGMIAKMQTQAKLNLDFSSLPRA